VVVAARWALRPGIVTVFYVLETVEVDGLELYTLYQFTSPVAALKEEFSKGCARVDDGWY